MGALFATSPSPHPMPAASTSPALRRRCPVCAALWSRCACRSRHSSPSPASRGRARVGALFATIPSSHPMPAASTSPRCGEGDPSALRTRGSHRSHRSRHSSPSPASRGRAGEGALFATTPSPHPMPAASTSPALRRRRPVCAPHARAALHAQVAPLISLPHNAEEGRGGGAVRDNPQPPPDALRHRPPPRCGGGDPSARRTWVAPLAQVAPLISLPRIAGEGWGGGAVCDKPSPHPMPYGIDLRRAAEKVTRLRYARAGRIDRTGRAAHLPPPQRGGGPGRGRCSRQPPAPTRCLPASTSAALRRR
ncbi:hypothetical protein FHW73_002775 [Luteimonas sp. RC10]|nr:hypothetical protein [Luteimonas sp. RC10]